MMMNFLAQLFPEPTGIPKIANPGSGQIGQIMNVVLAIIGAIAVLTIVIAGFTYVLSQGDSQKIGHAKDAIIYALIGLAVTIFAGFIVNFVILRAAT